MTPKTLSLVHRARPPLAPTPGKPPLLLLLHGVGSNEHDLMGLANDLDPRFFVVSARAPHPLGPDAFGWYHLTWTADGPVGQPEEARSSRDLIATFITELISAYDLDAGHIYLTGFSQGAIMSLYLALTQPEHVAGIVAMSGRLLPEAWDERAPDEALKDLPILVVHGTGDAVLLITEGRNIRSHLSTLPVTLTYHEYPMAHQVSQESLTDITAWLTAQLDAQKDN